MGIRQPKAVLKGHLYVKKSDIGEAAVDALKRELTFHPRRLGADHDPTPLPQYDESVPEWIGVPRAWGRERFSHLPMIDRMSDGGVITSVRRRPNPDHPSVLDPDAQRKFMADMITATKEYDEIQAIAATGSGKTVVALNTAAEIGRTTLIAVPWEHLALQWADEITKHLGVPRERIGFVQGPRCQYQNVDFAIAIFNSLAQRQYPKEFYEAFGTFILDESHKVGTEFFSPALTKMAARHRITLTATAERKDGAHELINNHVGPIRVQSGAVALPGKVYAVWYDCGSFPLWGKNHNERVACLTKDKRRNQVIVGHIIKAYESGRQMMIVSHSVDHLEELMAMCRQRGVPGDIKAMGMFTGEKTVMINGKPHYVKKKGKKEKKRKKVSQHELAEVKKHSQLFFTTYGKFKEGGDVPRLDCGIDATPRSDATQIIGRIRRPLPDKKPPLWITIVDTRSTHMLRYFENRCKDYKETGMEVINVRR